MALECCFDRVIDLLKQELELLKNYNKRCEELHQSLIRKDWPSLEKLLLDMRQSAEALSQVDQKRELAIAALKQENDLATESSFGLLLSKLSAEQKREIQFHKQALKTTVFLLQSRVKGIGRYSDNQSSVIKDLLSEMIPEKKGNIYNRKGKTSSSEAAPLLFNHHF